MFDPMKPDRRTILKTGAAAFATGVVAAPLVLRAQPAAIKVGVLQPVTGALAHDGQQGRIGAELAIRDINAGGGIKSLGGAKLEMVFGDAKSTPEGGTQEVERMQGEGVVAVVGGYASAICLATTQAAARYDLPYVVDVGVSDQIVRRGLKNTFRIAPGFGTCATQALDNLVRINDAAGKPARTVVLIHEDGLFGSGLAKLLQAELPKRGFEVLETIAHPTPTRDMSNVALQIRAKKPDLVIPSSYYGEYVLLARTMQQQLFPAEAPRQTPRAAAVASAANSTGTASRFSRCQRKSRGPMSQLGRGGARELDDRQAPTRAPRQTAGRRAKARNPTIRP